MRFEAFQALASKFLSQEENANSKPTRQNLSEQLSNKAKEKDKNLHEKEMVYESRRARVRLLQSFGIARNEKVLLSGSLTEYNIKLDPMLRNDLGNLLTNFTSVLSELLTVREERRFTTTIK